jgi:type I protein arginine methyltransferase
MTQPAGSSMTHIAQVEAAGRTIGVRARRFLPGVQTVMPSMGDFPIYDELMHQFMLDDFRRNDMYLAAIRRYATGRTVLDIGTGQYALWAITSAEAGAEHVYAVEAMPQSAELARTAITQAGLTDRITVLEGLSTKIGLPAKADMCVSEVIGALGGSEGAGAVLADARARLVRPGGLFIPDLSATTVVPVDMSDVWAEHPPAFAANSLPYLEKVFAVVGHPCDVRVLIPQLPTSTFLSGPVQVEELAFNGVLRPTGTDHRALTVTRDGVLHGFALALRLWAAHDDQPLDSLTQQCSWYPVLAPVSMDGIRVQAGARISFNFVTTLSDDGVHPDYRLTGVVGDTPFEWVSAHHGTAFRATDFYRELFPHQW